MIITKTQHNGILTIALDGRMDITTAPDLEREIKITDSGFRKAFHIKQYENCLDIMHVYRV